MRNKSNRCWALTLRESKICAALYDEKGVRLVPNAQGKTSTPACLFCMDRGTFLFGDEARNFAEMSPTGYASNIKRLLTLETPDQFNRYIETSSTPFAKPGYERNSTADHSKGTRR